MKEAKLYGGIGGTGPKVIVVGKSHSLVCGLDGFLCSASETERRDAVPQFSFSLLGCSPLRACGEKISCVLGAKSRVAKTALVDQCQHSTNLLWHGLFGRR